MMKTIIKFALLLSCMAACAAAVNTPTDPLASATAPEVNYDGLIVHEVAATADNAPATADTPVEPVYIMYFTETDAQAVAQMLWGEARGCTLADKQNCVRTVCNRVDDPRWGNTPFDVVTQYYQYLGYSPYNPIDPELYEIAVAVMTDWSLSKQGVPCEWNSYNSFWGDGVQNHFYIV